MADVSGAGLGSGGSGGSSSSSSFSSASSVGASLKPVVVGGVASFGDKENAAIAQFDIDKVTRPTGCGAWLNQVYVLVFKNIMVLRRHKVTTTLSLIMPVLFIILVWILGIALESDSAGDPNPPAVDFGGYPRCTLGRDVTSCITVAYAPSTNPDVVSILETIAENNDPVLTISDSPPTADSDFGAFDVWPFETQEDMWAFMRDNNNVTHVGINFAPSVSHAYTQAAVDNSADLSSGVYQASLWFGEQVSLNYDDRDREIIFEFPLQAAIVAHANGGSYDYGLSRKAWPSIPLDDENPESITANFAGIFIYCAMVFNSFVAVTQMVNEKEQKLRTGLSSMGLTNSAYWTSWFLTQFAIALLSTLLVVAAGFIFNVTFISRSSFFVSFCSLLLFQLSMLSFSFLISAVLFTVKTAILIAILFFFVGLIALFILGAGVISELHGTTTSYGVFFILAIFPFTHFSQLVADIIPATVSIYNPITNEWDAPEGYFWSNLSSVPEAFRNNSAYENYPPTGDSLLWMLALFFVYFLLAVWADVVAGGATGVRSYPWFFFLPSYWGCMKVKPRPPTSASERNDEVDPDVVAAEELVASGLDGNEYPLIFDKLEKRYGGPCSPGKYAVRGLTFAAKTGEVHALLGHNGAGKSTAMNAIVSIVSPTAGDVIVFGESAVSFPDRARARIGLCPQFDILWGELTAPEHLWIFARLKGVPSENIPALIDAALLVVKLDQVSKVPAGSFSGGMKRRLSVAIAAIGSPLMVLDEPTTGMDPVNRASVWRVIERLKANRCIVMSTHSMEEADVLGDVISVMVDGRLQVMGSSLHLKAKYGAGSRLTVSGGKDALRKVEKAVKRMLPETTTDNKTENTKIFHLPAEASDDEIAGVIEWLEDNTGGTSGGSYVSSNSSDHGQEKHGITDFGISATTMDEVFLKVTEGHEDQAGGEHAPSSSAEATSS